MCKFFMTVTKESATEDYREVNLLPVKQVVGLLKFTDCSTEVLDVTMPTAKCPVLFQRIRLKGGERREKRDKRALSLVGHICPQCGQGADLRELSPAALFGADAVTVPASPLFTSVSGTIIGKDSYNSEGQKEYNSQPLWNKLTQSRENAMREILSFREASRAPVRLWRSGTAAEAALLRAEARTHFPA